MSFRDTCFAVLIMLVWGLNNVVIKVGYVDFSPLTLVTLRFVLVAIVLCPFIRLTRQQLPWALALSVAFGACHFALFFVALGMSEVGTGSILVQLGTPFSTLLAVLFLRDPLGKMRLFGLSTAFFGAAILGMGPTLPGPLPFVLFVASAFSWAVANMLVKKAPNFSPLGITAWSSLFAIPQTAFLSAVFEHGQIAAIQNAGWHGWSAVAYTALVSSIVGYGLWYWLLRRYPVNKVVPFSLLNPVIAVILGAIFFAEPLAPAKMIGGALTLAGVGLIVWWQGREASGALKRISRNERSSS